MIIISQDKKAIHNFDNVLMEYIHQKNEQKKYYKS